MSDKPMISQRPAPPTTLRWVVLVVVSLTMFGNYYIYDAINPLVDVLKSQLGFTDEHIGMLQLFYSIPNFVMVLIGGILIDRLGTKKSTFIFAVLCLVGAAVFAATPSFPVMAAGRLIFGVGAESLIVAATTVVAKWFRGKELGFAFGLNLTIARLGSFAADNSAGWAKPLFDNWQKPLLLAVAFGVLCVLAAVVYWVIEASAERRYQIGAAGATDKVHFHDIMRFGMSYWLIVALCFTFYSAVFPFRTFAVDFLMNVHDVSRTTGGFLNSTLTLFAMIATPLFGLLADRIGRRALLMMFASLLLAPVFLMLLYTNVPPYVPMAMMGISFSLIPGIMWPSVAHLVEESKLGTAYGLMTLVQNVGFGSVNWLIGKVNADAGASALNPDGYAQGIWIFTSLGLLACVFAWLLRRRERGPHGHGLETITVTSGKQP